MKKTIVGGLITLILGGTAFTISQSSVVNNFAKNSGMSHQQAQQFVNNSQKNLQSFSKIGQALVSDGNKILSTSSGIDCVNYTYQWVTSSMSCSEGVNELQTIGNNEIQLGNCYEALGSNLGNAAKSKISECINDIDTVETSYNLPIAVELISSNQLTRFRDSNLYNKSVLQAALGSN